MILVPQRGGVEVPPPHIMVEILHQLLWEVLEGTLATTATYLPPVSGEVTELPVAVHREPSPIYSPIL